MERVRLNNARLTERAQKAADDQTSYQVLEEQRKTQDSARRAREGRMRVEEMKNRKEIEYASPLYGRWKVCRLICGATVMNESGTVRGR